MYKDIVNLLEKALRCTCKHQYKNPGTKIEGLWVATSRKQCDFEFSLQSDFEFSLQCKV